MYLGRFQRGDSIPLSYSCVDINGATVLPNQAPTASIHSTAGTLQGTAIKLPVKHADINSSGTLLGFFSKRHFIGSLSTGRYNIFYQLASDPTIIKRVDNFDVIAGGSANGDVIAIDYTPQFGRQAIQYDTEDGNIFLGKNPV